MSEWFSSRDGQDLIRGTLPRIAKAIEGLTKTLENLTEISKLHKEVERLQLNELVIRRVWKAKDTVYNTYDLARGSLENDVSQPEEVFILYNKREEDVLFELKPVAVWFTKKDIP